MPKPIILIPGSYDVPTNGHEAIWRAFAEVGDVVIAVGRNADKSAGIFSAETRAKLCDLVVTHAKISARVEVYDGALVDAVNKHRASLVVRGVRGPSDLEEGFVFSDHLSRCGSAPIVFSPAPAELRGVSSSLVRQLLKLPTMGAELKRLIPKPVYHAIRNDALGMRSQFEMLWNAIPMEGNSATVFDDLLLRYGGIGREYHTMEHVRWALKRLDEIMATHVDGLAETDKPVARWAIWFHDAVMTGLPDPSDEELSADLAFKTLTECRAGDGHHHSFATNVRRAVLATGHNKMPTDAVSQCVVDADLSILGADEANFDRYEALIREEWSFINDNDFRAGRTQILKRFEDREYIYSTSYARNRWEPKARANLARSLKRLTTGMPYPQLMSNEVVPQ